MSVITWRNVNAPSAGAAASLLQGAGNSINNAVQGVTNLGQQFVDASSARSSRLQQGEINQALAGIQGLDQSGFAAGSGQILGGLEGKDYDLSKVYAALGARENTLNQQETRDLNNTGIGLGNQQKQFQVGNQQTEYDNKVLRDKAALGIAEQNLAQKTFQTDNQQEVFNSQQEGVGLGIDNLQAQLTGRQQKNNAFELTNKLKNAGIRARTAASGRANRGSGKGGANQANTGAYITDLVNHLKTTGQDSQRAARKAIYADDRLTNADRKRMLAAADDLYGTTGQDEDTLRHAVKKKEAKVYTPKPYSPDSGLGLTGEDLLNAQAGVASLSPSFTGADGTKQFLSREQHQSFVAKAINDSYLGDGWLPGLDPTINSEQLRNSFDTSVRNFQLNGR